MILPRWRAITWPSATCRRLFCPVTGSAKRYSTGFFETIACLKISRASTISIRCMYVANSGSRVVSESWM